MRILCERLPSHTPTLVPIEVRQYKPDEDLQRLYEAGYSTIWTQGRVRKLWEARGKHARIVAFLDTPLGVIEGIVGGRGANLKQLKARLQGATFTVAIHVYGSSLVQCTAYVDFEPNPQVRLQELWPARANGKTTTFLRK